jgi:ankyrin repeat protein
LVRFLLTIDSIAQEGKVDIVKCLVKQFGANINHARRDGVTPLMVASFKKHVNVVRWLINEGADTQAEMNSQFIGVTATDLSKEAGASAEQTAYLEAKTHCSNPGCSGPGIKRCPACKLARYCGEPCQYAH